jgi:hypothetical protein
MVASYPLAALPIKHRTEKNMDYVLSANGQSILKKWGFLPVN